MKLREFMIGSYGRLKDNKVVELDKNFVLFYGGHGEGKSLTIEAIIKMLLDKKNRDPFDEIINRRYEIEPRGGYLDAENAEGKKFRMPEEGKITDFYSDLTSWDFRNIFVTYESDLRLSGEGEYYKNFSDRITGLRTGEISDIIEGVQNVCYLSSGGKFRSTRGEDNYLGERFRIKAPNLLDEIGGLEDKMEEKGFEDYEISVNEIRNKIDRINRDMGHLDNARKREKYERGTEALESIKESLNKLGDLEQFNEDDHERFKEAKKTIEEKSKDVKDLKDKLGDHKNEHNNEDKRHDSLRRECDNLERTDDKISKELKPKIDKYKRSEEGFTSKSKIVDFTNRAGWISAGLLAASVVGVALNPIFLLTAFAFVFFVLTLGSGIFRLIFQWEKGRQQGKFVKIKHMASEQGLTGETLVEIDSRIKVFEESLRTKEDEERESDNKLSELEAKVGETDRHLKDAKKVVDGAKEIVEEIKKKSGVTDLDDYKKKYERKNTLEGEIEQNRNILLSHFGSGSAELGDPETFLKGTVEEIKGKLPQIYNLEYLKSLKETENRVTAIRAIDHRMKELEGIEERSELAELMEYWNEKASNLQEYEDKSADIEFDEDRYTRLERKGGKLEDKKETLEKRMKPINEKLQKTGEEANRILYPREEPSLQYETSFDLKEIKNRLQDFIDTKRRNKKNALEGIKIFKEIEEEEKEKISEILEEVSDYFSKFTKAGRIGYEEVILEPTEMKLKVREKGEERYRNAITLSSAELDMLYFSVRLALARKLFRDEVGFFILDDAFAKESDEALEILFNMLRDISEEGWQILYFSAKGDVIRKLSPYIESGFVQEAPVPSVE